MKIIVMIIDCLDFNLFDSIMIDIHYLFMIIIIMLIIILLIMIVMLELKRPIFKADYFILVFLITINLDFKAFHFVSLFDF